MRKRKAAERKPRNFFVFPHEGRNSFKATKDVTGTFDMVLRGKILISAATIGLASLAAQPKRLAIVIGNSMTPTYHAGELLVTKPLDRPLRHGDVVVVNGPDGPIL